MLVASLLSLLFPSSLLYDDAYLVRVMPVHRMSCWQQGQMRFARGLACAVCGANHLSVRMRMSMILWRNTLALPRRNP